MRLIHAALETEYHCSLFLLFTVMKKNSTFFAVFCAVLLLASPRPPRAQQPFTTIAINSVSGTTFCAGDPLSVTFTVTGTWGHTNAFTLQLSNDSGTFDNGFTKLGSVIDTAQGTFTINTSIPPATPYSSHYRFRVIGAYPYTVSEDSSDILVGEMPSNVVSMTDPGAIAVNDSLGFGFASVNADDTLYVDFGSGANQVDSVSFFSSFYGDPFIEIYSTGGWKTITLRCVGPGGCSVSDTFHIYVYDCTNPVVPHDAVIVSTNTVFTSNNESYKTFWVNPGVSLTIGDNIDDTIFAEAGASIFGQNGGQTRDIEYLKTGATSDPDFEGMVVYAPGASVTAGGGTLECSGLAFDYTVAPPNSIMHINDGAGVATTNTIPAQIEIFPNPTNGIVMLQNIPMGSNVMVMNVLGETVQTENARGNTNLTLDLSNSTAGTYYIRIASGNSVTTKSIVKE